MKYESETEREAREWAATIAGRIAAGLCVIDREHTGNLCITHGVDADFGHYLDTRPKADHGHNPLTGIAYND